MGTFNVLGFALSRALAQQFTSDPNELNRLSILGAAVPFPLGPVVTLTLARREADSAVPAPTPGPRVEVPDVVSKPADEAEKALQNLGLVPQLVEVLSSTNPKGIVASQNPEEGTLVSAGDSVTLFVSKGDGLVDVPDVRNQLFDDARRTIEAANLTVVRQDVPGDSKQQEHVIIQTPDPNTRAARDSSVTLFVGTGKSGPVKVPPS